MRMMNEMAPWARGSSRVAAAACAALVLAAGPVAAQSARHAATLAALAAHPIFFHGEEVVLRTEAMSEQVLTWLVDGEVRVLALDVPPPPDNIIERLEIVGTFYDVGRLEDNDPRVRDLPLARLSNRLLNKPWPTTGELPIVVASSSRPVRAPDATTMRNIVLDPDRYVDAGVTLTGRFRGRNLYADLPAAPDESRWDFVLRSADAAVWVVGKEPKGDGFELDVAARVDTGRWLEVTGTVSVKDDMVLVEAGALRLAEPAADATSAPAPRDAPPLLPPEVIFSAPLADDVNVARDTTVRVQFSRDMDRDSFEGNIHVGYAGSDPETAGASAPAALSFETDYHGRNRVLEIRVEEELDQFRALEVRLLEGITANDGAPLPPWTLSFFTGD